MMIVGQNHSNIPRQTELFSCCKVKTYYELLGDNINTIMYTFYAWFFKSCLLKDTFTVINGIPCTHVAYTCIYFGK